MRWQGKNHHNRERLCPDVRCGAEIFFMNTSNARMQPFYSEGSKMPDGFFRMNAVDFSRPRGSRNDFLLVPQEKNSGDVSFLALENIGKIFSE